ncbi:MAG: phage baseplate assembly protein V [Actinobacteria bacterium]|nr:phage baseplate assembly protein V [Actinomycetota bacterium]
MRQVQGLPELIVTLGGQRLVAADTARIVRILVHSALGQPTQCQVAWAAEDALGVSPDTGDALRIELGGRRTPLFSGEVTVVEYSYRADTGRQVRVRAYDALHRLRKRQSTRLLEDTDLRALTEALAAGTGLAVEAPADPLGPVYQVARSDLDLLVEVAGRHGRHPVVRGGTLHLVPTAGDGEPATLAYGSTLHAAEIEVSAEPAFRGAEATWWDPVSTQADTGRASASGPVAQVRADPAPGRLGGGGDLVRADELRQGSLTQPTALAGADLDVRSQGEVTAVLVVDGDPALQAGGRVRLQGVRSAVEGVYPVTEATHEITVTGYETTLSSRPPAPPRPRARDQVTLGVVSDVDDPEDRGRVRVRLPAYPDLETGWAPVLLPAAGADKGVVALPEVDDHVLVLLPGHDPAHAIVLGGLYGPDSPPLPRTERPGNSAQAAPALAGGAPERGATALVRTRDGQQVVLDGTNRILSLTDGHGSSVELGPALVRITAATDVLIEAPGRALRVRARTVDFEEAP